MELVEPAFLSSHVSTVPICNLRGLESLYKSFSAFQQLRLLGSNLWVGEWRAVFLLAVLWNLEPLSLEPLKPWNMPCNLETYKPWNANHANPGWNLATRNLETL